jgi:hypothetical protein
MELLLSTVGGLVGVACAHRLEGLLECATAFQRWAHRFARVLVAALVPALVYRLGDELLDRPSAASLLGVLEPCVRAVRVAGIGTVCLGLFRTGSYRLGAFLVLAWILPAISTQTWVLAILGVDSAAAHPPVFCVASLHSAAAWVLASQLVGARDPSPEHEARSSAYACLK